MILKQTITICWRKLLETLHQRKLVVFLIFFPVIFIILFGSVFGTDEKIFLENGGVVIGTWGFGNGTGGLQATLSGLNGTNCVKINSFFTIPLNGVDETNIKEKVTRKEIALVTFPSQPSKLGILCGPLYIFIQSSMNNNSIEGIEIGYISNVTDLFEGKVDRNDMEIIKNFANRHIDKGDAAFIGNLLNSLNVSFGKGDTESFGKRYRLIDILIPEFIGMVIMWVGVTGSAISAVSDRVSGVRTRMLLTPTPRSVIVLGNTLGDIMVVGMQVGIIFVLSIFFYKIPMEGSYIVLFTVIILTVLSMVGIGLIIAHFSKSPDEAFHLAMIVNLPMMLMSTSFLPIQKNCWISSLAYGLPLYHANDAIRSIMLYGYSFSEIGTSVTFLAIIGMSLFIVGVLLTNKEM